MSKTGAPEAGGRPLPEELAGKVRRARLVLFWERLWPALWPLLAVAAGYLIVSLFGLWTLLPAWAGALGIVAFALAALAALWPVYRLDWPGEEEALRRLEAGSGLSHRPATATIDQIAANADDRQAQALWAAHKARMRALLRALRPGLPRSDFIRRDPWGLRAALGLLLIIAFAHAGPAWRERLAAPLGVPSLASGVPVSVDAWIAPPAYTGRPPVYLTGASGAPTPPAAGSEGGPATVTVPGGSELVIRAGAGLNAQVSVSREGAFRRAEDAGDAEGAGDADDRDGPFQVTTASDGASEFRAVIDADSQVTVTANGSEAAAWAFSVTPDTAPVIRYREPPERTVTGTLKLSYSLEDDYGVVDARATVEPLGLDAGEGEDAEEPLIAAPQIALVVPQRRARAVDGETFIDLQAHPWAGTPVRLTLRARDEAGNAGSSEPARITLPQRDFSKPLARAVVEQRRILALTPSRRARVVLGLDLLTTAPAGHIEDSIVYLALRAARARLAHNTGREQMISVVDLLWDVALRIEDGDLSIAERNLRAAQEALQDALARDASDAEVERLMEELRQALNAFMQALAEAARDMPEIGQEMMQQGQVLSPQDLQRMLDQIEDLARGGARDMAQQMLSQLRAMLENLRTGQAGRMSPQQQQMSRSMQEMADLIQRQQQLMDETFRLNQQGPGEQGEDGEGGAQDLARRQQELQSQLQKLLEELQGMGAEMPEGFGEAERNMGDASRALGEGAAGEALGDQGRALENLRQGAQGLVQQLAQGMMGQPGMMGVGPAGRQVDPLGRPIREPGPDLGLSVEVPDEIDAQTVRRILDELRRRLGEQERPRLELDYLERLLKQF